MPHSLLLTLYSQFGIGTCPFYRPSFDRWLCRRLLILNDRARLCDSVWPKANVTVAWGNAPGKRQIQRYFGRRLYSHQSLAVTMDMAFGQTNGITHSSWGGAALAPGYGE